MNRRLIEYASWRVVSEVFRRHPNAMRYLHTTTRRVSGQISPLDRLLVVEALSPRAK